MNSADPKSQPAFVNCVNWRLDGSCAIGKDASKCATCQHRVGMVIHSKAQPPKPAKPANDGTMRGLGDVIARIASALGIKQKPGCGCKQRQEKLNKLVPFKPGGA
jgi:hypothetical protein